MIDAGMHMPVFLLLLAGDMSSTGHLIYLSHSKRCSEAINNVGSTPGAGRGPASRI